MDQLDPGIIEVARKRARLSIVLTCGVLVAYFGFILLVAFGKPFLSILIGKGLSVGIVMGAAVIVVCWVLAFVYASWANTHYDSAVARAVRGR